jgi:hypothetical protein
MSLSLVCTFEAAAALKEEIRKKKEYLTMDASNEYESTHSYNGVSSWQC